jgi:hypothetical protein
MLQDQAIIVAKMSFLFVTVVVLNFQSLAAHYVVQCGRLSLSQPTNQKAN